MPPRVRVPSKKLIAAAETERELAQQARRAFTGQKKKANIGPKLSRAARPAKKGYGLPSQKSMENDSDSDSSLHDNRTVLRDITNQVTSRTSASQRSHVVQAPTTRPQPRQPVPLRRAPDPLVLASTAPNRNHPKPNQVSTCHNDTDNEDGEDDEDNNDGDPIYEDEDTGHHHLAPKRSLASNSDDSGGARTSLGQKRQQIDFNIGGDSSDNEISTRRPTQQGRKRTRVLSSNDGDNSDIEIVNPVSKRQPKTNSKVERSVRPQKATDYDTQTQGLLLAASAICRTYAVTTNPFPSLEEAVGMADESWMIAQSELAAFKAAKGTDYYSIIRRVFPQVQGRLRDKIRPLIADTYMFDDRPHKVESNRQLYLRLVERDAYVCTEPDKVRGHWMNRILYKALKAMWFNTPRDEGLVQREHFKPIPPATIALVFTTVRLCLDEWRTGSHKQVEFKTGIYDPIYRQHLANLTAIDEVEPSFTGNLGEDLYKDCAAPFAEDDDVPTSSHSVTQITAIVDYYHLHRAQREENESTSV